MELLQRRLRQAGQDLVEAVGQVRSLQGSNQALDGAVRELREQIHLEGQRPQAQVRAALGFRAGVWVRVKPPGRQQAHVPVCSRVRVRVGVGVRVRVNPRGRLKQQGQVWTGAENLQVK